MANSRAKTESDGGMKNSLTTCKCKFVNSARRLFHIRRQRLGPARRLYIEEHMSTVTMPKPSAGDSQAFEGLFHEHHLLVYRTAYVITGSPEDAEDVLQTIFLRLMRKSAPPDIRKNPKGYFYKAAVRCSLDTVRERRREVLTSDFSSIEDGAHRDCSTPSNATPAFGEALIEMLTKLTPRTVEIVTLRYIHDYTEPEIAKLLHISRGTVAVTLFRARMRLRRLLRASSIGEKK